jgi:hypothetical protein
METTLDRLLAETVLDTAQRLSALEHAMETREKAENEIKNSIKELSNKITPVVDKMMKWESRAGAFFFVIGCVWTFFIASWKWIIERLGAVFT